MLIEPEDIPNIVALRKSGCSWGYIAHKYDCAVCTIFKALRATHIIPRLIGLPEGVPLTTFRDAARDAYSTGQPHVIPGNNGRHLIVMTVEDYENRYSRRDDE